MSAQFYFVVGDPPVENLKKAKIIFLPNQMLGGKKGFLFPSDKKAEAVTALGWDNVPVITVPTSEWSTDEMRNSSGIGAVVPVAVECHDNASPAWCEYLEVVRRWCSNHDLHWPVLVHYCYGNHGLGANGFIHLCFGGSCSFRTKVWAQERDVSYQRNHFWVGELGPEHSYCRILIPTLLESFMPLVTNRETSCDVETLVRTEADSFRKRADNDRKQLSGVNQRVRQLQYDLQIAVAQEAILQQQFEQSRALAQEIDAKLRQQLDQIKARSFVKHVSYNSKSEILSVQTERITIQKEAVIYDMGEYLIEIYLRRDVNSEPIKIFNLTREGPVVFLRSGRKGHHPHVDGDGYACLGTIKNVIPRFLGTQEYVAVVDLLHNYLQNADASDGWGRTITQWPKFVTP